MVKPTKVTNSIRSLRFAQGEMTQADLASRIGVTRQTVIAIEKGRYSPSLEMAFLTAQALNVPLDDVFQHPVPSTDQGDKHTKLSQQAGRFVDEVRKLKGIAASGRDDSKDLLSHEANKQILGCESSDSCLAEIAR